MRYAPLVLLLLAACAAPQTFATRFTAPPDAWSTVLARARAGSPPELTPVVVGVADEPRSVFAFDLANERLLFRAPAAPVATPIAAGEFVIVPEAARVLVHRLRDGGVLREIPSRGMHFVGASSDGTFTAVVLSSGGTLHARSRLVVLRGEQVALDQEVQRALGAPAVLGGVVFIPHNRVHVSALSPDGTELARVRVQHDVASYAFAYENDVYFGQRALTLLEPRSSDDTELPTFVPTIQHKLPGNPAFLPDTNVPPPPLESAVQRIAVTFAPHREGREVGLANGAIYATYYPILFGLAADGSTARWAYEAESDVLAVRALSAGLLAVEARGAMLAFDPFGTPLGEVSLGLRPIAASIRSDRLPRGASVSRVDSAAVQLERVARNADARLVPARAFAATLLGGLAEDEAASALIALSSEPSTPERVRDAALEALAQRAVSSASVIEALTRKPDFVADAPQPPLLALARAAARSKDTRAVAPLLSQLANPAATPDDLAAIFDALVALRDPSAAGEIAKFVRLYHADDGDVAEVMPKALEALAELDLARARPVVMAVAADPLSNARARGAAERLAPRFATEEQQQPDGESVAEGGPASEPTGAPEDDGPPVHLTTQHVDDALAPVRAELARCVRDAPERPASARLVLVVEGDGTIADVRALPESVLPCVAPLVRDARLPATKYMRRSVMSYVVPR